VRFLIDEMYPDEVCDRLNKAGHDAVGVRSLNLGGASDSAMFARAIDDDRVVVTENVTDFVILLQQHVDVDEQVVPVVFALKRSLPVGAGAMSHALAEKLTRWSDRNPAPYRHAHWLE
jgi:hypothetical protein